MILWLVLSTIGLFFSLAVTWWIHSQYLLSQVVEPVPPPPEDEAPWISVIVPARNEARNIAACLEGLLNQTYPHYEVVVIDDRSTDATPQILARLAQQHERLVVLQGSSLPSGWAGKPHALYQGVQAARKAPPEDSWLCFVDADTFACPELLASTLASARATRADLFTILTDQKLVTFWERVILPLVFTALSVGFSPRKVNDPDQPDAVANGQFMLFRRAAYDMIGGHRAVANSIVEDRDLAQVVKSAGLHLVIADGRLVATTRMYTSFQEIWEGWTKNIYLGLAGRPRLALLGVFGALLSLLAVFGFPAWVIAGSLWLVQGGGLPALAVLVESLVAFTTLLIVRAQAAQAFHISPLYGLTLPLGALVFAAMMVTSAYRVLSGRGVTWKGRHYLSKNHENTGNGTMNDRQ